jgi:hypothetical protein
MNALRAPLTALAAQREKCCYFLLDNADVVIDDSGIGHSRELSAYHHAEDFLRGSAEYSAPTLAESCNTFCRCAHGFFNCAHEFFNAGSMTARLG